MILDINQDEPLESFSVSLRSLVVTFRCLASCFLYQLWLCFMPALILEYHLFLYRNALEDCSPANTNRIVVATSSSSTYKYSLKTVIYMNSFSVNI